MTQSQTAFHVYSGIIKEREYECDLSQIVPILEDMRENDNPAYSKFVKVLNYYYRNLCQRVMEDRQQNLSFDFGEEAEQ